MVLAETILIPIVYTLIVGVDMVLANYVGHTRTTTVILYAVVVALYAVAPWVLPLAVPVRIIWPIIEPQKLIGHL